MTHQVLQNLGSPGLEADIYVRLVAGPDALTQNRLFQGPCPRLLAVSLVDKATESLAGKGPLVIVEGEQGRGDRATVEDPCTRVAWQFRSMTSIQDHEPRLPKQED